MYKYLEYIRPMIMLGLLARFPLIKSVNLQILSKYHPKLVRRKQKAEKLG